MRKPYSEAFPVCIKGYLANLEVAKKKNGGSKLYITGGRRMTENSIAYCGLVCSFCCTDGKCSCKSENNCGKRLSPQGCYQYDCCTAKGIKGCWECSDSPCDKDMLAHDKIKMRAFVRCIKEDGIEKFIGYLERNEKDGIIYHRSGVMGDYDLSNEKEVLNLLRRT